jgi:hypothetical protein
VSDHIDLEDQAEDATELAGWMYADLFLALMVIFLATISFVPQLTKMPQTKLDAAAANVSVGPQFDRGASQVYASFDAAKIQSDLHAFEKKLSYPTGSEVLYAQIIGGYGAGTTDSTPGNLAAIDFSVKLKSQLPEIFGHTSVDISTTPLLPKGAVLLRLTLVPPIDSK